MDDWKAIANYLWIVLVGVIKILWDKQEDRFKKGESKVSAIEAVMYTKHDAQDRRETVDEALEARRQDVIQLHAKIDTRAERIDDKVDQLARDMHQGLSEIKTILLERR